MKILPFLFGIILCSAAHAEIGSVTELSGDAMVKRGRETISITKGTKIEVNDNIVTKNGRLKIKFEDDTTVTVTESSSLLIDDFVYSPSSKSGKLGLKATMGTVRYVSGKIAHSNPNAVKINTPTAAVTVRGTDFSMSVAETGASMIILLPSCDIEQNVNLRGLTCGSGRIDVDSGGTVVVLDRPYQATMVETSGQPPSPPVVVDLNGSPVGNSLMLSPPRTGSGASIVAAAKAAAERTGDRTGDSQPQDRAENQQIVQNQNDQARSQREDTMKIAAITLELTNTLKDAGVKPTDVSDSPFVYKTWRDGSQTVQTGWGYERLSPSGFNYANIALGLETKALLVVTQDLVTDAYNSNILSSKSYGTIVINQSYK